MTKELILSLAGCITMGYLIGCISPSYIIGLIKGYDVRKSGSNNAGASNTVIMAGPLAGLFVAVADIFKAWFAWRMAQLIFPRVALAGVLAMQPEYLILDEPVAGLDPEGKENMLQIIEALHKEAGITIIMVSHDIESVAKYADRVIVLEHGQVKYNGSPERVFYLKALQDNAEDETWNIPVMMQLLVKLRKAGLPVDCRTVDMRQGIMNIKAAVVPYMR